MVDSILSRTPYTVKEIFNKVDGLKKNLYNRGLMSVVAVIPCYNVERYCREVIIETLAQVDRVILIDDGSTDGTSPILEALAQEYPRKIERIRFPHNRGKGKALLAAFRKALEHKGIQFVVTLDSDAQHKPIDIPRFVRALQEGADLVIGSRQVGRMPFRSRFANGWITRFLRLVYPNAPSDTQSGFRGLKRSFVEQIVHKVQGRRYEMEFSCLLLALAQGLVIRNVPISTVYIDRNRSSHFAPLRDSVRILWVLFLHIWRRRR